MGVYYPVALVSIQVRLEEFGDPLPPAARAALAAAEHHDARPGVPWIPGLSAFAGPGQTDESEPRTLTVDVVPASLSIRRNPMREADQVRLRVRWDDLPVDPLLVRSVGIAAFLGSVDPGVWDAATSRGVAVSDAAAREAASRSGDFLAPGDLRFSGYADSLTTVHDGNGDVLELTGRDWTGVLLDTPVPPDVYRQVRWGEQVEAVVREVLATLPVLDGIAVRLVGPPEQTPPPSPARGSQHVAGTAGRPASRSPRMRHETYWELLTAFTAENGYVLYGDVWPLPDAGGGRDRAGVGFALARPTALRAAEAGADLPFREYRVGRDGAAIEGVMPSFARRGRKHPGTDETAPHPVMVFGTNLASLSMSRRLGRTTAPSIELCCVEGKETLTARYPDQPRAARVHPSGLWATDDVEHVQVFGARSRDELARVAPQVFREKGLGEVTCRFETRDMASLGGDNSDPDLLELRAGSVVEVQVARIEPGGTVGTRQAFQGMGEPDLVRLLVERHEMDRKAAGALARALTGGASAALRTWYVREVEHAWDAETGYSCRVEAVNSPQVRVVEGSHA